MFDINNKITWAPQALKKVSRTVYREYISASIKMTGLRKLLKLSSLKSTKNQTHHLRKLGSVEVHLSPLEKGRDTSIYLYDLKISA